jgi:D-sedoheptulose 7-phosphate isomerase
MKESLFEHIDLFNELLGLESYLRIASIHCTQAILKRNKIMFIGNGGSAADAQHLAAELVGRFVNNRRSLAGLALSTDTSVLTCIGNDYGYENIFSRQLEGLGKYGDVLIAISTSGNSSNIINAITTAKEIGIYTVGFLGRDGGAIHDKVDLPILVAHNKTARIQEAHIFLGHILCQMIENDLNINDLK